MSGYSGGGIVPPAGDIGGTVLEPRVIDVGGVALTLLGGAAADVLTQQIDGSYAPAPGGGGGGASGCLVPVRVVDAFGSAPISSPPSGSIGPIDGYNFVTGDRILLTAQTAAKDNGVWIANTAGVWTRPADFATGSTVLDGTLIPVGWTDGSTLFASLWLNAQDGVVGTNDFGQFIPLAGGSTFQTPLPFIGAGGLQEAYSLSIAPFGRHVQHITGAHVMNGSEAGIIETNGAITLPSTFALPSYAAFIIKDNGGGTASYTPHAGDTVDGSAATIGLAAWTFKQIQTNGTPNQWITI